MMIRLELWNLEVYVLCAMMISLDVWKYGSLCVVCDDCKFGSLEVCILCVMMIRLEV